MSKKILKTLLCLAGIAAIIAGVIYFIANKKKENNICEEEDESEFETEDETLDAGDALDLSSLTFSRHYVDLR